MFLANDTAALLQVTGVDTYLAHRPVARGLTGCGRITDPMKPTTLVAVAVFTSAWCRTCWPESSLPGWPLHARPER